jgi:transglutaminase-like putative cysteine protease
MTLLIPPSDVELNTPGASVVWTASGADADRVRAMLVGGEFARLRHELESIADPQLRDEARQMMHRITRDFPLDPDAVLQQLRAEFADAREGDVAHWTRGGELQHRLIDGQPRYFRRAVANLLRFNVEAQRRRDAARATATQPTSDRHGSGSFALAGHLEQVVAAATRSSEAGHRELHLLPVRTTVTYRLAVHPNRPGVRPGSLARVWLPFPKPYGPQRDVTLHRASHANPIIAPETAPQRTIYLETIVERPDQPLEFEVVFSYVTAARYPQLRDEDARPLPADWGDRHLVARPPHVLVDDAMRSLAREIVGDQTNPLAQARKLFEWIDAGVRWCHEVEYSILPSLPRKLLETRRGDCGVQSMLYISLCRSIGIPARWQSGWTTDLSNGGNLHDWTEVYVEPFGWIVVDPSYGRKQHPDPRVRDFYFGHNDRYRMIVSTDYAAALVPPKPSWRSEPLDFQRGEVEIDGRNLYFDEWDYDATFEHADLAP